MMWMVVITQSTQGAKGSVFFLKVNWKGGEGNRTKKLNAFSKIQNYYCNVGKRQCDKAESMEK